MEQAKSFKICLVSISLAGGGAERSCAMLSGMLTNLGHQVHLVILNDEIDFKFQGKLFNLGKLKDINDHSLKRFLRFRKLRNYLIEENFDVIIDHRSKNDYLRELFYDQFIYSSLKRIYVIHSSDKESYFTKSANKMATIYNKNVTNVSVSDYIKNKIALKLGVEKCEVIYNAFDSDWENASNKILSEIENKTYILSYGRIDDSVKDFSFLIKSFQESKVWENDVSLVIMGDGKDKENLKKLVAKLPCKEFVVFLPFNSNPFSIIKKAKFVTLTSKYEGFPMVLVETLSMGIPVVSLDIVSGPSEIINHKENGLLIKKREVSLFAEALHIMCTNIELYEYCKSNTKSSVQKFSDKIIAEQWNQLLQNELH